MSALPHQPFDMTRHGRAADALIASYVRELIADDELEPSSPRQEHRAQPGPPPAAAADPAAAEQTL